MFNVDHLRYYIASYMVLVFLAAGVGIALGRGNFGQLSQRYTQILLTIHSNTQAFLLLGIIVQSLLITLAAWGSWLTLPEFVVSFFQRSAFNGGAYTGVIGLLYALICGMLDGSGTPRHGAATRTSATRRQNAMESRPAHKKSAGAQP